MNKAWLADLFLGNRRNMISLTNYVAIGGGSAGLRMQSVPSGTNDLTIARRNFEIFLDCCLTAVGGVYANGRPGAVFVGGTGDNVWNLALPVGVSDWTLPEGLTLANWCITDTDGRFECWDMPFGWDVAQSPAGESDKDKHNPRCENIRIDRRGTTSGPVFKLWSRNPGSNGYIESAVMGRLALTANTTAGAVNDGFSVIGGIRHRYGQIDVDLNGNAGWNFNFDGYWNAALSPGAYVSGTTHSCEHELYGREGRGLRIANNALNAARITLEDGTGHLFISSGARNVEIGSAYFEAMGDSGGIDSYIYMGGADSAINGQLRRPEAITLATILGAGGKTHAVEIVRGLGISLDTIFAPDLTGEVIKLSPADAFAISGVYRSAAIRRDGTTTAYITGNDPKFIDATPDNDGEAFTSGDTLTASESGKVCSNVGASGTVILNLPAATVGMRFSFVRLADFAVRIEPNGTNNIGDGAGGKYFELTKPGRLTLVCRETSKWTIETITAFDDPGSGGTPTPGWAWEA